MKRIIPLILFSIQLFGLGPAAPIVVSPNYATGGRRTFSMPDMTFSLDLPNGWGIFTTNFSAKNSEFVLAPFKGGAGCTIKISGDLGAAQAEDEVLKIAQKFNAAQQWQNGFEVKIDRGWYGCYSEGGRVIELTYRIPPPQKKKKRKAKRIKENWNQYQADWNAFKKTLIIKAEPEIEIPDLNKEPIVYVKNKGWVFKHPEKPRCVLFKDGIFESSGWSVSRTNYPGYLLKFEHSRRFCSFSGFFSLEWDLNGLDLQEVYLNHLKVMETGIKKVNSKQKFFEIDVEDEWAIWYGDPYILITVSASSDFLIGFALKINETTFMGRPKIDDVIDAVIKKVASFKEEDWPAFFKRF